MSSILTFFKKNYFNLFIISLFLVRTPPIKIPFFQEINSHYFYRIINIVLFLYILFKKDFKEIKVKSNLIIFCLLYFITQALSVVNALNYQVFFTNFEKMASSVLFILISYVLLNQAKKNQISKIITVLIVSTTINVFIQTLIVFFPDLSIKTILPFFHSGVSDIVIMNLNRNRLYFEFYDEIIIPILVYFVFDANKKGFLRLFCLFLLLLIIIISFVSNVRTRFFVTLFVLTTSLLIYFLQYSIRLANYKKIFFIFLIITVIFFSHQLVTKKLGYSIVDRFLLESKNEDTMTLFFRLGMLSYSLDMGYSYPFFGVGLGNFFEHLPAKLKVSNLSLISNQETTKSSLLYPHNIFAQTLAETGFLGLIAILALIFYCFKTDWTILKNKNNIFKKMLIVSFWGLLIFSLFNPVTPLTFYTNFFLIRLLIEIDYEKIKYNYP